MTRIWSDEARLARMLDVELAALAGWTAVGVVPADAVERIRAAAVPPTPERVAELERETNHDVAAFVDAVAETLDDDGAGSTSTHLVGRPRHRAVDGDPGGRSVGAGGA
jgi:adenylosuccinate lyase